MTRKVIARHLGIPAEAIKVDVMPDAPAPVARALQARHAARQAAEAAAKATREAIDALARDGYRSTTRRPCCRSPGARSSTTGRPRGRGGRALVSGPLPASAG